MSEQYGEPKEATGSGSDIWKFENVGDKHEGVYRGERQLNPQYPPLFVVGNKLVPSKAQVVKKFRELNVQDGDYVWLEFKGKASIPGGKTVNNFSIKAAKPKEAF